MRLSRFVLFSFFVAVTALPSVARAQSPALVPIQGQLFDASGEPINTATTLTIALYATPTGGDAVFTESQAITPAQDGGFIVYAGQSSPLDLSLFANQPELWVGLTVAGDSEITPRFRLGTAPYAGYASYAGEASTLEGASASDFAAVGHTHAFSELTAIPAGLEDGDDVLSQSTVEGYARGVCYDTPSELASALTGWDSNASDDLTTATTFSGDVTGRASALQISRAAVGTTELADNSVNGAKIADGAVATADLADSSVSNAKIANNAVTAIKIAANAVGPSEINANAVGASEIAANAVGPSELNTAALFEPAGQSVRATPFDLNSTTFQTVMSRSITIPTGGTVVALASWEHRVLTGTSNTGSLYIMTDSATGTTGSIARTFWTPSATSSQYIGASHHAVFQRTSGGRVTVYLRGRMESSAVTVRAYQPRLLLFFIPN